MKTVAIEIQLTKRYVTVVDDEDADLATVKWQAQLDRGGMFTGVDQLKPPVAQRLNLCTA